jgi:HlyD family secretion protein
MLYLDTVKRGSFQRQVRGNGTLVPEQIQLVQTETDGRVERVLVLPGATVKSNTVLVELSNPELKQATFETEWQLKGAEAQLMKLKVQLQSDRLSQEATVAALNAECSVAKLDAEADEKLAKEQLVDRLTAMRSRTKADQLAIRCDLEQKRFQIALESDQAQLAVQEAEIARLRAQLELKRQQVAALQVRAGIDGVLQQIGDREMLQVGQRVTPAAILAKVVRPDKLKAEIKIIETQAKDTQHGQKALIDTRNGVIAGHVVRIDPAVVNGTVTVDVTLDGPLPKGARPDLSVEGTIELERLENVLYVRRPVNGQPESTVGLFKVINGGPEAVRVPVKLGRGSVKDIEVVEGLKEGDQIILSDMSQWDAHDRVRID